MISKEQNRDAGEYEQEPPARAAASAGEILIATVAGIDGDGHPLVEFTGSGADGPLAAMSLVAVTHKDKGRQAALTFAEGDPARPVLMGLIHSPLQDMIADFELLAAGRERDSAPATDAPGNSAGDTDAYVDGERVVLEGKEEIVLKCGDASITLTKAGKILIRGKYLLNRSAGVNRIMGGSVQVN